MLQLPDTDASHRPATQTQLSRTCKPFGLKAGTDPVSEISCSYLNWGRRTRSSNHNDISTSSSEEITNDNLSTKINFINLSEMLSPKTYALLYSTKLKPTHACRGALIPDASSNILCTVQPHIMDSQYEAYFIVTLVAPAINGWLLDLWEICRHLIIIFFKL